MKVEEVKKVAIFGAGTMGPGLAQVFATAGYDVTMYSRRAETIEKAMRVTKANLSTFVEEGMLSEDAVPGILARITTTQSVEEAATDADFVIESIVEKIDAKKALYEELDALCAERAILTSNTSYLNIYEVMPAARLPQTVIAHWFAPPHIVPLVEVVKGPETTQETVDFVVELLKKVDRVPTVLEKFVPGFCINRLLRIIGREVFFLLDNGYMTAEQLDLAVKASIIPRAMVLGFVQRYDFTGIDLSYGNLQNPDFIEAPIDNNPRSLRELMEKGHLGVKTGKGFFDYSDRPLEQVLKERDAALIRVFRDVKDLIYKRI
ncbi:MAG: 3-hydroxyacyl-CoA dehydrogenase family protein [Actinomycetia bacterium]|nr:3-hydroxyacyl-CoA dehydrogenase family protein [Actinomycetes bacterium]